MDDVTLSLTIAIRHETQEFLESLYFESLIPSFLGFSTPIQKTVNNEAMFMTICLPSQKPALG